MRTFEKNLCATQLLKLNCLAAWYRVLESRALRMDSPDDYHDELLRQAMRWIVGGLSPGRNGAIFVWRPSLLT